MQNMLLHHVGCSWLGETQDSSRKYEVLLQLSLWQSPTDLGGRGRGVVVGSSNKSTFVTLCTKAQSLYWISVQNEWNVQWIGPIFAFSKSTYFCLSYLHCTSNRERNICSSLIGAAAAAHSNSTEDMHRSEILFVVFMVFEFKQNSWHERDRPHLPG